MINLPPFSSAAFLDDLRSAGVALRVDDAGRLLVQFGSYTSTPELNQEITRHRGRIIEILAQEARQQTLAPESSPTTPFGSKLRALAARKAQEAEGRRLIRLVRAGGGQITTDGTTVNVRGFRPAPTDVEALKNHKTQLIALLQAEGAEVRP